MRNIILIITDTFRYDNLGERCAEMPVRTPQLDRFAAEMAVEVHGFYTGSFPTIPHRTDIATGRIGWPHYGWQPIDLSGKNHIARILGRKGYATQLLCDCPHLFNARFDQGFEAAYHLRGQEGDRPVLHLNDPIEEVLPPNKTRTSPMYRGRTLADLHEWTNRKPRFETELFPSRTAEMAVRWLEENAHAGPFFLWVDFFDPHEPWNAPEYLVRRYDPDYEGPRMLHPNYGPSSAYTHAELRNLRAHYAAEAELVDRWIGRVLQKIDDLELWKNSVVVVTSDHGMSVGEHARTGKSNIHDKDDRYWPLYPELGHVPFLIAAPDLPRGAGIAAFGQPCDFLPTVCELADVVPEPPEPFHGRSMAGVLRAGSGKHREFVVSGCCARSSDAVCPARASTPFVITDRWGWAPIGASGKPELYDLAHDPLAARDVAAAHADVMRDMQELLVKHLRDAGADEATVKLWTTPARQIASGSWARDYMGEAPSG
jgi:arylsulfatase A-like enzyme